MVNPCSGCAAALFSVTDTFAPNVSGLQGVPPPRALRRGCMQQAG